MVRDYVLGKLRRLGAILWRIRRGVDKMIIHKCLPFLVKPQCDELIYSAATTEHTLHSVYDLHGTDNYFVAECRKLSNIMKELGHEHIDLLKLDIEGAWRKIIQNIVDEHITSRYCAWNSIHPRLCHECYG